MLRLGVPDPDPGAGCDAGCALSFADFETAAPVERIAAEAGVEAERLADFPRTGQKRGPLLTTSALSNRLITCNGLAGANQDRGSLTSPIGDQVQHLVQAITQIDIRMAWRPPHGSVAGSETSTTVIRAVVGVTVGLDLGDA